VLFVLTCLPTLLGNSSECRCSEPATRVFILDSDSTGYDGIERFSRDGTYDTRLAIDYINTYRSVTPQGPDLLVANFINNQILRFNQDGVLLGTFATINFGLNPQGQIETDAQGNVYAVRNETGTIDAVRLNPDGSTSQTFSNTELTHGIGIDADANGNVYVRHGNAIFKFAPNGAFLTKSFLSNNAGFLGADLAIDEARNILYAGDDGPNGVRRYDISGPNLVYLGAFSTPLPTNHAIFGLSVEPKSGSVFAVDIYPGASGKAFEFAPDGTLLHTYMAQQTFGTWDIVAVPVPVPEPSIALLMALASIFSASRIRNQPRGYSPGF
jgi:DNA-binding beta-propeller fold protein YncE